MEVEVKLDGTVREPRVIVITDKLTEEVNEIIRRISETEPRLLTGLQGDQLTVLDPADIYRIYSADGKVLACTKQQEYVLRLRLYELEEKLQGQNFVRISNSEIVNLKKVKSFDLSLVGTICVTLSNGEALYVSRRYVARIKKLLMR